MPHFSLNKIDRKIAKLQQARELIASDPEMAILLADCLSEEQEGVEGAASDTGSAPIEKAGPVTPKAPVRLVRVATNRIGLHETVAATARSFNAKPFNVNDVYKAMGQAGFPFRSRRPSVSVGIELRKLYDRKKLELLERGSGSTPSIFRNLLTEDGAG